MYLIIAVIICVLSILAIPREIEERDIDESYNVIIDRIRGEKSGIVLGDQFFGINMLKGRKIFWQAPPSIGVCKFYNDNNIILTNDINSVFKEKVTNNNGHYPEDFGILRLNYNKNTNTGEICYTWGMMAGLIYSYEIRRHLSFVVISIKHTGTI